MRDFRDVRAAGSRVQAVAAGLACLVLAHLMGAVPFLAQDAVAAEAGAKEAGTAVTDERVPFRFTGMEVLGSENCEALSPEDAVTVEAWLRPDRSGRAGDDGAPIVVKGNSEDKGEGEKGEGEAAFMLTLGRGNTLHMAAGGAEATCRRALRARRLSHVAGVCDSRDGTCRLYVDGREAARGAPPAVGEGRPGSKLGRTTGPLLIGAWGTGEGGGPGFRGEMVRVAVYNRALSHDEIARLAAEPDRASLDLPGTIGEWDFREGDARFLVLDRKGANVPRRKGSVDESKPFDPTSRYEERRVEGWRVLANKGFVRKQPALFERTHELLRHQLYQVTRKVPAPALAKLRKVTIWLEAAEPHHACATYHPNPQWLREHGMNPEKGRSVEFANARNFLAWTRHQPWMAMHELAHAYHHQFLEGGYDNAEIRAEFERAMKEKLYDSVLKHDGRKGKAYAASNPMEYFAENTEAFFGANDFYPFVNAELKQHDPKMYALLEKLWGTRKGRRK